MKLSEMQASPDTGRPELTFDICVAGKLLAQRDAADEALFEATAPIDEATERAAELREQIQRLKEDTRPKRLGAKPTNLPELVAELEDIEAKLPALREAAEPFAAAADAIRERMLDHTITLHLVVSPQWRAWVAKHPARDVEDDKHGALRDMRVAFGFCDADALIADAAQFIARYGEEEPTDGSWEFVAANAAPGDLDQLAAKIVTLHEEGVDLGKSRLGWLSSRGSVSDSP